MLWLPIMLGLVVSLAGLAAATPAAYNARPYAQYAKRQASYGNASTNGLQVDLGYSVYQGFSNASAGIDNYYGYDCKLIVTKAGLVCLTYHHSIRFAAPPTGKLRFQAPQAPVVNDSAVIPALEYGATCLQTPSSGSGPVRAQSQANASEDCLFVSSS